MNKKLLIILLSSVLIIIIGINLFLVFRELMDKKSYEEINKLQQEYELIYKQPGDTFVDILKSRKATSVLYGGRFISTKSFDEIRNFYDIEFKKNGWQYESEENIKDWGKDYGGKTITYTKGGFILHLESLGNQEKDTYYINLNWDK